MKARELKEFLKPLPNDASVIIKLLESDVDAEPKLPIKTCHIFTYEKKSNTVTIGYKNDK